LSAIRTEPRLEPARDPWEGRKQGWRRVTGDSPGTAQKVQKTFEKPTFLAQAQVKSLDGASTEICSSLIS
jgi:hypothetical protein